MSRSLAILTVVMLLFGTASATNYYFSDCASGGTGTIGDPWCLDPPNVAAGGPACDSSGSLKVSFSALTDACGTELAAGDTIYLCAGACDGSGTGTYNVDDTQLVPPAGPSIVFIVPKVSGTALAPITISVYPGETVVVSGDSNGNNIADAGDVGSFFNLESKADSKEFYHFIGDPQATGTPHLSFVKVVGTHFFLKGDPGGWVWDGIEIAYTPECSWSGGVDTCNYFAQNGRQAIRADDTDAPNGITIRNSIFHHIWDLALRQQNAAGGALIENNIMHHLNYINNDFANEGTPHTWRGNTFYDFGKGMAIEDQMQNVLIEDNTFYCLNGLQPLNICEIALIIYDGNPPFATFGLTRNVTIRRNLFYDASGSGKLWTGIWWNADWFGGGDPGYLIENNVFWGVSYSGSNRLGGGTFSCAHGYGSAIGVGSNVPVVIQNNTIYDAKFPITLDNQNGENCAGGSVNHIIRNNIILQAIGTGIPEEVYAFAGATGSIFQNNLIHPGNQVRSTIVNLDGVTTTCANVASIGTGNKCVSGVMFKKCSNATFCETVETDYSLWDLHLVATDTINKDAGTTGAADDVDKQARPFGVATDIGADEFQPSETVKAKVSGKAKLTGKVRLQ